MLSVSGKEINFKMVERKFYEIGCAIVKTMMKEFLEELDKDLAKNRGTKELRHKGKKENTKNTNGRSRY